MKMAQHRRPGSSKKVHWVDRVNGVIQQSFRMKDSAFLIAFASLAAAVLVRQVVFFAPPLSGLKLTSILQNSQSLLPSAVAGPLLAVLGCMIFLGSVRNLSPGFLRFCLFVLIGIRLLVLIPIPSPFSTWDVSQKNPYTDATATGFAELPEGTGETWTVDQCPSGVCDNTRENASMNGESWKVNSEEVDTDEEFEDKEAKEQEHDESVKVGSSQESTMDTEDGSPKAFEKEEPPSMLDWMVSTVNPAYSLISGTLNDAYARFVKAEKVYGRDMRTDHGKIIFPEQPSTALVPVSDQPLPHSLTEESTGKIIIHHSPHFQRLHKAVHHGKQYNVPVFNGLTALAVFVFLFCGRHIPLAAVSLGQTSGFLLWHSPKFLLLAAAAVTLTTVVILPLLSASIMDIASTCFASLILASIRMEPPEHLEPVEQTCRNWVLALVPNPLPGYVFSALGAILAFWSYNFAMSSFKFALCSSVARSYTAAVHGQKPSAKALSGMSTITSDLVRNAGSLAFASLLLGAVQGAHWACSLPVYLNQVHPYVGLVLTAIGGIPLSLVEAFINCIVIPLLASSGKTLQESIKDGVRHVRKEPLSVLTLVMCCMAVHWVLLPLAMGITASLAGWASGGLVLWFGQGVSPFFLVVLGSLALLSVLASVVTSVSWCTYACLTKDGIPGECQHKQILVS